MLARMRAFAEDPCKEIGAIAKQVSVLERAEPDETRRTSPARKARYLRDFLAAAISRFGNANVCRALKEFVPTLTQVIVDIDTAVGSGSENALVSYHQLSDQLRSIPPKDPRALPALLTWMALGYHEAATRTQCARFEGTAGTEVGMTMFYTDLLAKLWMTVDHGLQAPTLDVAGFLAHPRMNLPAKLETSSAANRGTRVWFGPRAGGVSQVDAASSSIFFDHVFARIYAAGNDPAQPGIEVRPNESARRAIGWWNRHYEDVADHEQEYHRLNQIMKWSLVTGALSSSGTAPYLRTLRVRRDREFGSWYRAHQGRLRFTGALPIDQAIAGKQCLPIFESYPYESSNQWWFMSGGVGTATSQSLARVPVVDPAKPLGTGKPLPLDLVGNKTGTAVNTPPRLVAPVSSSTSRSRPRRATSRSARPGSRTSRAPSRARSRSTRAIPSARSASSSPSSAAPMSSWAGATGRSRTSAWARGCWRGRWGRSMTPTSSLARAM
jgi:hypothetical protein